MTSQPQNRAAWLKAKQDPTFTIDSAPYSSPGPNEVTVKTLAVAMNPVDHFVQASGYLVDSFPFILGSDIVGRIVELGSDVKGFEVGDRVMGEGFWAMTQQYKYGGYQEYVVLQLPLVCKVPDDVTDEQAAILPLTTDTAAACLFAPDTLGLTLPPSTEGKGETVIVWGGSSAVGCRAIQMATAAGYEVVTLASKKNFGLCESLGANRVFDYNDEGLADDMLAALKEKYVVGAVDCLSLESTIKPLCAVLDECAASDDRKIIAGVRPDCVEHAEHGVTIKPVFATTVAFNGVGAQIWQKFMPKALESGSFPFKPEPSVQGEGLEDIQAAITKLSKGVSATKFVVKM